LSGIRRDLGDGNERRRTKGQLPTSTVEHNKKLDAEILKREPPDRDAPWWQRKFWATLYSTWRGLRERH
jgi:hypothetical protein